MKESMYEVQFLVTLQVVVNDNEFEVANQRVFEAIDAQVGAREAVENALKAAELDGYSHRFADYTSTAVVAVDHH